MVLCEVSWESNGFKVKSTDGWEEKPNTYTRPRGCGRRLVKKSDLLHYSWSEVLCLPEDVDKAKLVLIEWHERGAKVLEEQAVDARQKVAQMREALGGKDDAA